MTTRALILVSAVLAPALAHAQQNFDKIEIKTTKLRDGVYMLQGAGGNMGLVTGPDGALLIDDEFAPLTKRIVAAVKKVTPKPIRFLLNTHWHGDHTGGNANLAAQGVTIVAQENVRKRLERGQLMRFFHRKVPPAPKPALPVITFDRRMTLHYDGETIEVRHSPTPAHTDGDAVIRLKKANVLHCGDTFFNGLYPFIDGSSGGSLAGMAKAAARNVELADAKTKVIPGHGPLGTRQDLVAYRDMLTTVLKRIRKHLDQGETLAQVVAAKPTKDFDPKWGHGFLKPDVWVKLVTGIEIEQRKRAKEQKKE